MGTPHRWLMKERALKKQTLQVRSLAFHEAKPVAISNPGVRAVVLPMEMANHRHRPGAASVAEGELLDLI